MKVYEINNFSLGYDDSVTDEMSPPETTQDSQYIDYSSEIGALQKDMGERNIGGGDSPSVVYPLPYAIQRIYEGSIDTSGGGTFYTKRMIFAGGYVYMYCAGNKIIPLDYGGLLFNDTSVIPDVTTYYDEFIMVGGHSEGVYTWDGLTNDIDTLGSFAAGGPNFGANLYRPKLVEVFKDRLFTANLSESTDTGATWTTHECRVRYTKIGNPVVWDIEDDPTTDASYVDMIDKEGNEIVRLWNYGDYLLVFKKHSIHKLINTLGSYPFEHTKVAGNTTNVAPWSIAPVPVGLLYLDEGGLKITDGNSIEMFPADKKITALLKRIYQNSLNQCWAISHDSEHEYWLSIPIDGSSTCNRIIVYNWKYDTWRVRVTYSTALGLFTDDSSGTWASILDYYGYELIGLSWNSSLLYPGSKRVIIGRSDGYVREKSIAYNMAESTTGYNAFHVTPWLDLEEPGVMKEVVKVQPLWEGTAGDTVTVSFKSDSDTAWTTTTSQAFNDTAISEQPFLFMRKTGRKFRFKVENNNANEFFRIYKMKIFYEQRSWR